jgi:PKD repeat protein/glucose/arabinose dehydrogenase
VVGGTLFALIACALGASTAWAQISADDLQKTQLVDTTLNPMEIEIAPDGTLFYIERRGIVGVWDPETETSREIGTVPVTTFEENGLLGIALDPNYELNGWIYLAYSVPPVNTLTQRVSRFQLDEDGNLDLESEIPIFEWTHLRETCCHSAGALEFDPDGNLLISTGDNTNPFESQGYAPIDERPGRQSYDAQRTSANTNDHNGKLLRIKPLDVIVPGTEPGIGDTYEIPEGNMFGEDGDPLTLPEIHSMGFRNPFRFKIDEQTGWALLADYGPDAGSANPNRGPAGTVEFNVITEPINSGWPYCVREDTPYIDYDFQTQESGDPFDCENPVNDSPNNTGRTNLPPVFPASMWQSFGETDPRHPGLGTGGAPMAGPRYYYDPDNPSPTKFPEEFDGKWFIASWNNDWIKTVDLDEDGNPSNVQDFPNLNYLSPMDMEFGPDGALYLAEWGQGFQADHPESGIYRIDYVPQTAPKVTASADPDRGTVPLEVSFDAEGTNADGTPNPDLEYEWDFGDGNTSDEEDPVHTYTEPGIYQAEVTVTDPDTSEQGTDSVTIRVDPEGGEPCTGSRSDEFDGDDLDRTRWSTIIREEPDRISVSDGALNLVSAPSDIYAGENALPNIILQPLPGGGDEPWSITTEMTWSPTQNYQNAGLMIYGDDDNYIKTGLVWNGSRNFELIKELEQNPNHINTTSAAGVPDTFFLRYVSDDGTSVVSQFSADGESWSDVGETDITGIPDPKIGIYAMATSQPGAEEITANFHSVTIEPDCEPATCFGDAFDDAALDTSRWNDIVRPDDSLYRLEDGVLWVETVAGDIYQDGDPSETRNFILQSADHAGEDWTIETKVLAGALNGGYSQGGLLAYADDDNYVKLDVIADQGQSAINRIELRSEVDAAIVNPQPQFSTLPAGTEDVWLRLSKEGDTYTGEYSFDGESWTAFEETVANEMSAPSFGLFTLGVQSPGPEVGFEYFALDGEIECGGGGDNTPPAIDSLAATPTAGFAPLEVSFEAEATDADGDELSYSWDFGDGNSSDEQNPSHTYTEAGEYEAEVTVSDGTDEVTDSVTITVLPADDPEARFRVLAFSKTAAFRHGSIPAGHAALDNLAEEHDFQVDHTEDSTLFTPEILSRYDTVVFLSTTGDVLNDDQQAAFEEYIRSGGGFTGIHAASDTEYDWNWYGHLVGAYFRNHPPGTPTATVNVEDHDHPSTEGQPDSYEKVDEWYNFKSPDFQDVGDDDYSPRENVHVLATVDESTYNEQDGNATDDDHPIIWCQRYDGGRSWYTGMGHTNESFSEPEFLQQLLGGLETTAGVTPSEACGVEEVDTTPPVTTHELDPADPGEGGTYEQPVDVTLSAVDPAGGAGAAETHVIEASGFNWVPADIEIKQGDTVEWDFNNTVHDICIDTAAPVGPVGPTDCGDDELIADTSEPGGSKTFTEPGTYAYYCSIHYPGMEGTIEVLAGEGDASGVDRTEYRVITDGTPGEWTTSINTGLGEPFVTEFTVSAPGDHVVEYRSYDRRGNEEEVKSVEFSIAANTPPAIDSLAATPTAGFAPLEVSFEAEATDADGDELSYSWDFGDGNSSDEQNPSHTYTEAGEYEAEVTVSDGTDEVTDSVTITVLPADDPEARFRVLAFSKTAAFRHGSIPAGHAALDNLAEEHDFQVDHTEDSTLFTPEILSRYDTVVFLSTTGDVLNDDQQAAFEEYIRSGGGFTGIHAASDTEYDWNWYGHLVGAYFRNHPPGTPTATVNVEDHDHPSTEGQPDSYEKVDEWYNFKSPDFQDVGDDDYSPRENVHVLATVDESTYNEQDGNATDDDHPIIWCQRYDGGRSWYTGMGHTNESFSEPEFLQQLLGGLETTAGVTPSEACGVSADNEAPVIETISADPQSGDAPLEVTFNVEATDPNDDELTYEWDFGDGSPTSNEQSPTHTYTDAGTYQATVTVSDGELEATDSVEIVVGGPAGKPRLQLRVNPKQVRVGRGQKRARFRFRAANVGDAASGRVKLCVKAPKRKLKVIGKNCVTRKNIAAGKAVARVVKLRVGKKARGKVTRVKLIARGPQVGKTQAVVRVRVRG